MRVGTLIRIFSLATLLAAGTTSSLAQRPQRVQMEQILDFHSDISLEEDSSLQVTETITVVAGGNQIRHGIYRDFPTHYSDNFNNRYDVGFQMLAATRDSVDEPFRVEDYANGKRVYLGNPNAMVPLGRHVYTISYSTNRQLGFFKDHDELFWNVTGLGWGFPIQHASASVHLSTNIPAGEVKLSGFTGPQGSKQTDLTSITEESRYQFATTRPLRPHEGLTILLMWPKGFVAEPTLAQKMEFFFHDNGDALVLAGGFLVLLLYYFIAWSAVGRDPAPGVIMAQYQPPQELSPAATRYLLRMGFDNKTFAATILDMAVRGFLTIKEQDGSYALQTTGKDNRVLSPEEKKVAAELFDGRNEIWLLKENHVPIRAALKALQKWLAAAEQKTYFVTNSRYVIAPVIFSMVIAIGCLVSQGGPKVMAGIMASIWLTVWTIGVYAQFVGIYGAWRAVSRSHSSTLGDVTGAGKAIFLTLFVMPFLFGEILGLFFLLKVTSLAFVVFVFASGLVHGLFLHLLKAPTLAGRRLMDQVQGFKMFLGAVDGDRLNRAMPPEQTPAVFEKFLPYALALDVEQDWAEKFSGLLAGAGSAPGNGSGAYAPSFYTGAAWGAVGAASFASAFSGSFTSAIASSSVAPGSGGGGGGGGSGGGGGGGGGGGW